MKLLSAAGGLSAIIDDAAIGEFDVVSYHKYLAEVLGELDLIKILARDKLIEKEGGA